MTTLPYTRADDMASSTCLEAFVAENTLKAGHPSLGIKLGPQCVLVPSTFGLMRFSSNGFARGTAEIGNSPFNRVTGRRLLLGWKDPNLGTAASPPPSCTLPAEIFDRTPLAGPGVYD